MATNEFFPARPASRPTIYAYQDSNPQYNGQLKVGYTTRTARERLDAIGGIKASGRGSGIHRIESAYDGGRR